ncbi:Zinc finger protein ZPR1-like protein [Leptotrombidium deliense]|uniref:Zinc finger protein ZPR1-like protein n=1 Tax=Leptotrombidium deliense TaxID=299467 RepID=A0A443SU53_9ACAR|nr:Zinc finger protein ZPR1-like protein [Leptotrombidium deliense]
MQFQGNTRILLTKIPYFKEVAVMSFYCEHCEWRNNELQPVATIQEKGVVYTVKCTSEHDLNREVVKTEWAEIDIPEIEFEVKKQSGLITTIEGIIDRAITGLNETLHSIPEEDKESKMKFSEFIGKLVRLKMLNEPFTFVSSKLRLIFNVFICKI